MKTVTLLLVSLSLPLASPLAVSQQINSSNNFDEFLTFDDNQVPPGWAITFPYGGPGHNARITKERFQIGQVDTYAALDKAKTLPAGMTKVHINIECDVKNIYYGSGYQIHLLMNDGGDFVVGLGKEGSGINLMGAFAGNYYALEFDQTYNPRYGIYYLDAVFQTGQIILTATEQKNGHVFATAMVAVPEMDITKLQLVRLFGIMTTGNNSPTAWIDNALIEALP
ncbi:MAG: hypothetical protein ACREIF_09585 [Chthoniobacterales bacterium]